MRSSASWVVSTAVMRSPQFGSSMLRRRRRRWSPVSSSTRPLVCSAGLAARMSPCTLSIGISNQKVEPCPASDSTPMRPPIRSMMRLEIASPRPVPPYRRVVEASAWLKAWNRRSCADWAMPMPVSRTSNRSWCWALVSPIRRTVIAMLPRSVNFTALLIRLLSTWRRRTESPRTGSRTEESICRFRRRPLLCAGRSISWMTDSSVSRRLKVVDSSCSLEASSFE